MNSIHLITLGCSSLERSLAFYRDGLGMQTSGSPEDGIIFFQNAGTRLALFPKDQLAEDIGAAPAEGFTGMTLAYNTKSEQEVRDVLQAAHDAGGTIVKEAQRVFWGGYSGYFRDPDGYYWEAAYSEDWEFNDHDMLIIKE
ncbi:VOC family protein [Alkalicoccus luteus]|uniref:VOC family protein n=1 Tax=Alkalicoccus luteus TaxID=1237094 RepID=A0A969TV65_9BACI|nr:VOC family protein [Alkalicoccus luteus]